MSLGNVHNTKRKVRGLSISKAHFDNDDVCASFVDAHTHSNSKPPTSSHVGPYAEFKNKTKRRKKH